MEGAKKQERKLPLPLRFDEYAMLESVEAKQKIGELVYQLSAQRTETERKLLEAATFAQRLQQQLKERIQRVEKLEEDRRYLYAIDNNTKAKFEELKETHERYQREKENEISKLKTNEIQMQNELATLRETIRSDKSGSLHQMQILQVKNQGLEQSLELLQSQLTEQTELARNRQEQLQQTHEALSKAELTLQQLQSTGDSSLASAVNAKRLQNQAVKIQELEAQNKAQYKELDYYRTMQRNTGLLEEEKKRLVARAEQAEEYRLKCDEIEAECAILRKEKAEWAGFLEGQSNDSVMTSPYKMSSTLMNQRIELVALTEQHGELQVKMRRLESDLADAHQQILSGEQKCQALVLDREADQRELKRYQRKQVLAQKEVAFLREQVKSYDIEDAIQNGDRYDHQKTERIEMLEKLLDEYQQEQNDTGNRQPDNPSLLEKIDQLTTENQSLLRQVSSLDDQVTRLEQATGHGDYDRTTTRVLQLTNNLAARDFAIRESTLAALRRENQQLLNQLEPYTSSMDIEGETRTITADVMNNVPLQSLLNVQAEKERLEAELVTKEKRMQRLKEIFSAKGRELREAVYSLLGYKFELLANGRVRLTSAYSSRDDHSFVFHSDEHDHGTMQLVNSGNDGFARSLDRFIRTWVVERGSIPAFLSAVTLELFKKQQDPNGVGGMRTMDMSNDDTELGAF
ncbi:spindle assembly checkpoint component Mad1 [Syncephalis fuscata]|nr:spindle assembly checkpoint component Mad1 [Syncephalis fuscata]